MGQPPIFWANRTPCSLQKADPTELYLWDLNGFLVVPDILDGAEVGLSRIVASEIEPPILLVNLVSSD